MALSTTTLGIGTESGPIGYLPKYYNVSAVYNENTLLDISNRTGGVFYKANTQEEIDKAVEELTKSTDTAMIPVQLSHTLLVVALALLFIEWGLISTRFRRIP